MPLNGSSLYINALVRVYIYVYMYTIYYFTLLYADVCVYVCVCKHTERAVRPCSDETHDWLAEREEIARARWRRRRRAFTTHSVRALYTSCCCGLTLVAIAPPPSTLRTRAPATPAHTSSPVFYIGTCICVCVWKGEREIQRRARARRVNI